MSERFSQNIHWDILKYSFYFGGILLLIRFWICPVNEIYLADLNNFVGDGFPVPRWVSRPASQMWDNGTGASSPALWIYRTGMYRYRAVRLLPVQTMKRVGQRHAAVTPIIPHPKDKINRKNHIPADAESQFRKFLQKSSDKIKIMVYNNSCYNFYMTERQELSCQRNPTTLPPLSIIRRAIPISATAIQQ